MATVFWFLAIISLTAFKSLSPFAKEISSALAKFCCPCVFCSALFASDEKPGRFFDDQPDVTDDYQIHFNYQTQIIYDFYILENKNDNYIYYFKIILIKKIQIIKS